jgi:hypothetical protein
MNVVLMILVRLLEALFLLGLLGSAVVILQSGVEDFQSIFEQDEYTGRLGQDPPTIAGNRPPA